jgi:hypothetical protein
MPDQAAPFGEQQLSDVAGSRRAGRIRISESLAALVRNGQRGSVVAIKFLGSL